MLVYLARAKSTSRMLSLLDECLPADARWAFAPDLFQKHLRSGGLEIKRRILGSSASAKSPVPILPDEW